MSIGTRIIELRNSRNMTRVQLAEVLDIPMTTLRNYEQDSREPGHKFLVKIANYFGVTTDYILENEKSPAPEGAEDDGYMKFVNELTGILESLGLISESGDITDEDRRFILSVASMLNTYFENRG